MTSQHLSNFIKVVDHALSPEFCRTLIARFNSAHALGQADADHIDGLRDFDSIMFHHNATFSDAIQPVVTSMIAQAVTYCEERQIPEAQLPLGSMAYEGIRMKRYVKGEGRFLTHVDVGDARTAKRALSCFWYLNTVELGGETLFFDQQGNTILTVKPQEGRLVIFPPHWMFPHSGEVPISGDKFLLGSYLHYTTDK